jgi:glutaredoxin 3
MHADLYSKNNCLFCVRSYDLLKKNNIDFTVIAIEDNRDAMFARVNAATGKDPKTAPQIFIDGEYVGGFDQLVLWIAANSAKI